ncbi:MAG: CtsR family transcriptional regulator [Clostridia bacterium]|nr:CtsR family transcriptional regulator [Clostridia bacterium]
MNISGEIEQFILSVLGEGDEITLSRAQLADYFCVAPSQINYVLSTRFNLNRGYITKSKRGGGGNITIVRIALDDELIPAILKDLAQSHQGISYNKAVDITDRLIGAKVMTQREGEIIKASVNDKAIGQSDNSARIRRNIYEEVLIALMRK